MTWIVVGDLSKIEKPIRDLKLGDVTIQSAETVTDATAGGAAKLGASREKVIRTVFLSGAAAAGAVGLINSFGNIGGYVGPFLTGYVNGVLIARMNLNPFITTLGMQMFLKGAFLLLANGKSVAPLFTLFTEVPVPGKWKEV